MTYIIRINTMDGDTYDVFQSFNTYQEADLYLYSVKKLTYFDMRLLKLEVWGIEDGKTVVLINPSMIVSIEIKEEEDDSGDE